jgi:hypothetical protein
MKAKIMFYDTMVGHDKIVLDFKGLVEYDVSKYLYKTFIALMYGV